MAKITKDYGLTKPEDTDFYDILNQNSNMDIIDEALKSIEDSKEPLSLKGSITVDNTSWVSGSYGGEMSCRKQVPIAGVTSGDTVGFYPTLATKQIVQDANVSHLESYDGGVYLYSETVPARSIIFDYRVIRG